jgi:hypothetical protein
MASTYLTRTNGSAVTAERKQFTISFWVKRSATGVEHALCSAGNGGGSEEFSIRFESSDRLDIFHYTNSYQGRLITNRKFRDTNAWYHIYFLSDTANGTAGDRMQLYINGVRETSFATNQNASQNDLLPWNVDERHQIGSNSWNNSGNGADHLNGCMSHFYNVAGSIIDVSQFGSTDSTTGEWKINTSPTIASYGTAGFLVLKDGNTVTDQSPNSNNFTASGDLTKTEDCPSNVYATANPLVRNQVTITTGNLTVRSTSGWKGIPATLGVESGKYYWEYKLALGVDYSQCGVMSSRPTGGYNNIYSTYVGNLEGGLALSSYGNFYHDGSSGAYGTSTWFSGGLAEYDIIGVALDATNNKIWFSQNGTWGNSSNPSTGSGGIDFSGDTDFTNYKPYFPAFSVNNSILTLNFGNGYLGTAEITTNGGNGFQDTDGNGRFYYAVPTNFRCLSTKGLNQ